MKKSQAFIQDFIIAIVIMSIVVLIYFSFYTNQNLSNENVDEEMVSDAKTITDYLTTKGYPSEWNSTNVARIGIIDDDYSLRNDKLEIFSNLTRDEYDRTRSLLKTRYDFIIFFRDYDGNILNLTNQEFIGKTGINDSNLETIESPTHISKIIRFIVLKEGDSNSSSKIIEMVTYVWSKKR